MQHGPHHVPVALARDRLHRKDVRGTGGRPLQKQRWPRAKRNQHHDGARHGFSRNITAVF